MKKKQIPWQQIEKHHAKCVCQTCTCHRHRCPHHQLPMPFTDNSTYLNDYIKHPLNPLHRSAPEKAHLSQPYHNLHSTYKAHYPGYQPQLREKILPRVISQDRNIPFVGESQYKNRYPGKSLPRERIINKDKIYSSLNQPFQGESTYKASYPKKYVSPHPKHKPQQIQYPPGYLFNPQTTYGNSYTQKPLIPQKSCKPNQDLGNTGVHDLNTIYRQDYIDKKIPEPCPILKMPERPIKLCQPYRHLIYNKYIKSWEEK